MRFYEFNISTNASSIKERATVNLRDYDYDNPVAAMNNYVYRKIKNGLYFFAYREEETFVRAAFSHDEKSGSLSDAFDYLLCVLREIFGIEKIMSEPEELTMRQFFDRMMEGRRRALNRLSSFPDEWFLELFRYTLQENNNRTDRFSLDESLIPQQAPERHEIYDPGFVKELRNIEEHASDGAKQLTNAVHYVISSRSSDAARAMIEALSYSLLKTGRVGGRRISMIRDIDPICYRTNYVENIIEYSGGEIMVIDLSAKFGKNSSEYALTAEYIVNLFKQYRNKCLFIFTYNLNDPGFSYQVLPLIRRYALTIDLREGSGDRKAALRYLTSLIKGTDMAQYASQAAEFMKLFPGDRFSQTDVIEAFAQFEPWCINKNVLKAYNIDTSEELFLDRDENEGSAYERLQKLIGLNTVKKQIDELIAANTVWKERKRRGFKDNSAASLHMVFGGNPGTAKTTVARLFAGVAKEKGLIKSGVFVECGGMNLNTFPMFIRNKFMEAKGGVLFVDEAYALISQIAIATFIQEIENHREDVIVILAGYNKAMDLFMDSNEGLKSRIPNRIDFPDYSPNELTEIFEYMIDSLGFSATEGAIKAARYAFEKASTIRDFGNGRYVRNFVESAIRRQSMRLSEKTNDLTKIKKKDLFLITEEDVDSPVEVLESEKREPGSAKREFDAMIGLSAAKTVINKAIAHFRMNKLCIDKGIQRNRASMHMVFMGNPGTAKTTVARLFAEMLKDEKVLPTAKFIEVGRADLVGQYVGSTAAIVKNKFREAKGGVLFIDEAYSLCDHYENGFGDEAINTIVQEMENNREDTIVIFAGYTEPMMAFLARNPGMRSRIAFNITFEDYSVEELCRITELIAEKKGLKLTKAAMDKLECLYEIVCVDSGFGNGRFVRRVLEEAEMNLAERLLSMDESELTAELITSIEEQDVPEARHGEDTETKCDKRRIGFD